MCRMSWRRRAIPTQRLTLGLYAQVIASKTDHGVALDGIIGMSMPTTESAQRGELAADAKVATI